jgi:Membrane bound beta barrel domain (DUF5777)
MRKIFFLFLLLIPFIAFSQHDDGAVKDNMKTKNSEKGIQTKVFYSQKLINANTVEVLPKGVMEFRVSHGFGDIGGSDGGIKRFFGLDGAFDVRIGFQTGLTKRLNLITARSRGASLTQLWELGLKYQLLRQKENDSQNPVSITVFANTVASSASSAVSADTLENSFSNFSDRLSEVVQVMIARKFGTISLQLSPTYVHRSLVLQNQHHQTIDDKGILALGGAARIPLSKKFVLILDYFHVFRSQGSIDSLKAPVLNRRNLHFYDPLGIGFEILTAGHVFHLNFTNATELLENRFIPRTVTNWGRGQFRWSFIISRNFILFRDKKNK